MTKKYALVAGAILAIIIALVAVTSAQGVASTGRAPGTGTPAPTPSIDPKDQPVPPGHTTPPGPQRWQARDADEVLRNIALDPFVRTQLGELTSPGAAFYNPNIRIPTHLGRPSSCDRSSAGSQMSG